MKPGLLQVLSSQMVCVLAIGGVLLLIAGANAPRGARRLAMLGLGTLLLWAPLFIMNHR